MATTGTITNAWEHRTLPDIFYEEPERVEDGMLQYFLIARIGQLLREMYEDSPDVFIHGDIFISYDRTDGNRRIKPDLFIAFDVPADEIREKLPNFWLWEIGKVPEFALEVASPSTAANDMGDKRSRYESLGITEYWRLDPTGGELYELPLIGERLVDGVYQAYELRIGADGSVTAYSELLNVDFHWDGREFDVLDPITGITIDKRVAAEDRADFAENRADRAEDRADFAENRADRAEDRAAQAESRASAERAARQAEREARLASEARERALLEEIERLRRQG